MKRIILLPAIFIICASAFGQTNITDETGASTPINIKGGNVGIGTTSPEAKLEIMGEGTTLEIDHSVTGGHSMIKFNSVVNKGSDKAFILFQDESVNSPGTGHEDVRLTMGVFNDFRSNTSHSDELWLQGGGRLVLNVGKWDSELNELIGTPSVGVTGGYEWRVNNESKMYLSHSGNLGIGVLSPSERLEVNGNIITNKLYITAGNGIYSKYNNDYILRDHNNGNVTVNASGLDLYLGFVNTKNIRIVKPLCDKSGSYRILSEDGFIYQSKSNVNNYFAGNVGIGTSNPSEKLSVNGTVLAKEIRVSTESSDWPDYVFQDSYQLMDLTEIEIYIKEHKHLPNIPSAKEMEASGVNLAEMNKLLLQKVEELTLYTIDLEKRDKDKSEEVEALENRLDQIELFIVQMKKNRFENEE